MGRGRGISKISHEIIIAFRGEIQMGHNEYDSQLVGENHGLIRMKHELFSCLGFVSVVSV